MKLKEVEEFIFEKPEKWFHIREISRKLKMSPNSVRVSAQKLVKDKIAEKRKLGNLLQVRANLDGENYKVEKRIYNFESMYRSGLADFLHDYYSRSAVILFGSYSRGEDTSFSDIDIAIITSEKKRPDLNAFEKRLARKINLSVFKRNEVSDEFFTGVINGIVLRGFLK